MVLCDMNNFSQTDVSPSFEERHVEGGRVEVDKLEDEHLEDEGVVVLRLCAVHLCERERRRHTAFSALCNKVTF